MLYANKIISEDGLGEKKYAFACISFSQNPITINGSTNVSSLTLLSGDIYDLTMTVPNDTAFYNGFGSMAQIDTATAYGLNFTIRAAGAGRFAHKRTTFACGVGNINTNGTVTFTSKENNIFLME